MPESVFWRSRRGGGDLTDEEVPEAARELFETWISFIQEPPFPEWNAVEAARSGGVDIGSEQREAWEKLTCLIAEPGVGQERLAMMLFALGRHLGNPEVGLWLRRLWSGQETVNLSAEGGEKPDGGDRKAWTTWSGVGQDKPDETDKRLAEINGALAALVAARVHLEELEGMETGVAKAHCQGHREDLRLIQVQLREIVGKEDF